MDSELMRKRLIEAREFIGCNRKAFAELLGMPYRTVTNYENGAREPGSDYLIRVADECGCTVDWLLGVSDSPRQSAEESATQRAEDTTIYSRFVEKFSLSPDDLSLIDAFLSLGRVERDGIHALVKAAVGKSEDRGMTLEALHAELDRQYDTEKEEAAKSEVS